MKNQTFNQKHTGEMLWQSIQGDYELEEDLGIGSFGQVKKATHKKTGQKYAIKLVQDAFSDQYSARKILREIGIQRKLSKMKKNQFTTKIFDIIIPQVQNQDQDSEIEPQTNCTTPAQIYSNEQKSEQKNSEEKKFEQDTVLSYSIESEYTSSDITNLDSIFIVMELMESDMKKVLGSVEDGTVLDEQHIITIIYNILCAMKFLHSANVIHRDLKPGNLLIDSQCAIKICDFGLARTLKSSNQEQESPGNIKKILRKKMLDFSLVDRSQQEKGYRQEMSAILENETSQNNSRPRFLTDHVASRWYRAPELILVEKDYDQAVDMWSIGCMLDEMIHCSYPYITSEKIKSSKDLKKHVRNKITYPGTSCYPLSPCFQANDKDEDVQVNKVSETDQLIKINQRLGPLESEDLSFITEKCVKDYQNSLKSCEPKLSLEQKYPHTSKDLLKVLKDLNEFNPYFRASAAEVLKNQVFDSIRIAELEKLSPYKINITNDLSDKFDYENSETTGLSDQQVQILLKKAFVKEVNKLKKMHGNINVSQVD